MPLLRWTRWFFYSCATFHFARAYISSTKFYLDMGRYLGGTERMPFQGRLLAAWLILGLQRIHWLTRLLTARKGSIGMPGMGQIFIIAVVSLLVTGFFARKIYLKYSARGALRHLIYPMILMAFYATYSMHVDQNFAYPYDALSLAFFTAGLYFILADQFWFLFLTFSLGTLNRETTLFLVGMYVIHQIRNLHLGRSTIVWLRVVLLGAMWTAVHVYVRHRFRLNDHSEDYLRVFENLHALSPVNLPSMLNIVGFLLPWVVLLRKGLPSQLRSMLLILPVWFAIMLCTGVLVETRIYGELASYTVICVAILIENTLVKPPPKTHLQNDYADESTVVAC